MEKNHMVYAHPNVKVQQQKFNSEKPNMKEGEKETINNTPINNIRPRMSWTKELHQRFLDIVKSLGPENAVPRNIIELMNVPGLTRKQISDHLHHRCCSSKSRPKKQSKKQQKQPSVTSSNVQLGVNHLESQNNLAITETQFLSDQSNGNQLQFSMNSLNDTMGSSSSNTLSDVKSTSSGITSMEYGELLGISFQLSPGNNIYNENKVAQLGSEGGSFQVSEIISQNFSHTTEEMTCTVSPDENTYKFGWEGIPNVFEGLDDLNAIGNYQYIEDSSDTLSDMFRSYIFQVRPQPQEFDDFDFDKLFPNEERDSSEGANGMDPK
ncbi:two-component response regulator ARR14-like isoform X2 [Macadamia integrifolia]|uniref:two-component response regulator ARR14-like isoform X2 n=1 Tax=Macadamia integrifolia TaxID=60698 RepID=UPI001C4F7A28|nr:two-component response regulator ARR14-like isoform X2 [Macadamia integrifolia]